jgi:hypothetical protein
MQFLDAAMTVLIAAFFGSKILVSLNRNTKRARVERQLHEVVRQYLTQDAADSQHFKEIKHLLMLDWLDVNPQSTRLDFCRHFDCLVDGHCESFAIAEYLRRREATVGKSIR